MVTCTDSQQDLPGSACETFPTLSNGTYDVGNVKIEEDIDTKEEEDEDDVKPDKDVGYKEEEWIDIKREGDVYSEEEEEEDIDRKEQEDGKFKKIPVGARFFAHVQTGPGAHPVSRPIGTGSFPGVKRPGRGADHPPPSSTVVKKE
jgi:hypothetical protein